MTQQQTGFSFEVYNSAEELTETDAGLLKRAKDITKNAYAPYSNFYVGAVAILANGAFVNGTNQENASYPVGICAERVLLSSASSQYPGVAIETIAISYHNKKGENSKPVSPCGICRQTLAEYEERQQQPIRLVLAGLKGQVFVIPVASLLLPLRFGTGDLK